MWRALGLQSLAGKRGDNCTEGFPLGGCYFFRGCQNVFIN